MNKSWILLLLITLSGCSFFDSSLKSSEEREFEEAKARLERRIEILRLEKRKLILENQIDAIESNH